MIDRITHKQVKQIAAEIATRWTFINHGTYYNCIDNATKQASNNGGPRNRAHYNFCNAVESKYLAMIGKDYSYFDYQLQGYKVAELRRKYVSCIRCEVERLLCGFTHAGREAHYQYVLNQITK